MAIEIDHISLSVEDFARAREFYAAALKPLRIVVLMELPKAVTGDHDVAGLGADGKPFLWLASGGRATHTHIALRAESRAQVDAFHASAIAAGGTDNGPPGLRPLYHKDYYGAFILDPEGHNIEAVTHVPDAPAPRRAARSRSAPNATGRTAAKAAGKTAKRAPAKRAAPKRALAKRAPAKPGPAKRAPAKRAPAKRAPAKRAATRPAAAKKPAGRKTRR
jgi:catechol 2,3-dioxygenase-like lactoylglutathione lyase family enzyme